MSNVYRVIWLSPVESRSLRQLAQANGETMVASIRRLISSLPSSALVPVHLPRPTLVLPPASCPIRLGLEENDWGELHALSELWQLTVPEVVRSLINGAWVDFDFDPLDAEEEVLRSLPTPSRTTTPSMRASTDAAANPETEVSF